MEDRKMIKKGSRIQGFKDSSERTGFPPEFILRNSKGGNDKEGTTGVGEPSGSLNRGA